MSLQKPSTARWLRCVLAFVAAWLVAALWGSLVQTQFNLQALSGIGAVITPALRATTSWQDIVGFGPVMAGIVLAAWLPAFAVAAWMARRHAAHRAWLFPLAGLVGLCVAIRVVDAVAPMPVLIYATRTAAGLLAVAFGAVPGAALYVWLTRKS